MTTRVLRSLAVGAVGALSLVAAACSERGPLRPEIRLTAGDYSMRISTDPMPPHARERQRWRVVVTSRETNQPIQGGEGRIFSTSRDGRSIWDGLVKGEEVVEVRAGTQGSVAGSDESSGAGWSSGSSSGS